VAFCGLLADVGQAGGGISLFVVDVIAAEFAPLMEQRSSAPNSCLRKIFFQPQPQRTLAPEALIIQWYFVPANFGQCSLINTKP